MEEIVATFAERLAELKRMRNLTNSDLARAAKINPSSIGRYLSGEYQGKQTVVANLCDRYNLDPAWIMGVDTTPEKKLVVSDVVNGLTDEESEMIDIMRTVPEGIKLQIMALARSFYEVYK